MISFLGKNLLLHKRNLVYSPQFHRCLIRFISTDSTTHNNSFTISCLINTCGFSQEKAKSATKRVHFESSTKPDSVLTLFRNNGFSDSQISIITVRCPRLLLSSVDKTLKPKFDFFNSKGFSRADITNILCSSPILLTLSLEKNIIPFFNLVENIVGTDAKVMSMFKRCMNRVINTKVLASNVALLRSCDVPDPNIATLLVCQPRVLMRNATRFRERVEEVVKMKFDPSEYRFIVALQVLILRSRSSLEAKFDVYKSWGWSLDEVEDAFRVNPICMLISKDNIKSKMDYFVNKLGYTPSTLAKQPTSLLFSYERIVPRCSVIQVLIANGHLKNAPSLCSFLKMTEDSFFKKYISKFEKEVPELLSTYQGTGKMIGLDSSSSSIGKPKE